MPTPSTFRPCPPALPHEQPDATLLRDLVGQHAEPLAQLLRDHLAACSAGAGHGFQAGAAAWRQQGTQRFSSWLFGVALALLRDSQAGDGWGALGRSRKGGTAAGDPAAGDPAAGGPAASEFAGHGPGLAERLEHALPAGLTAPLLALARSRLDDTRCALFLCKPAATVPDALNRIQT